MATYAELSAEDQAVVDNTVNLVRGAAAEMARIWNTIKAIQDDTNAFALVTSITAGETIPNTSGLAGSDDMTRSEVVAVWNVLEGIHNNNDNATNRAAFSKAAGVNAMLG